MTELIIVGGLVAVIIGQFGYICMVTYLHGRERRDLYSRIMARDLSEFTAATGTRPPPKSRNFVLAGLKKSLKMQAGDEE